MGYMNPDWNSYGFFEWFDLALLAIHPHHKREITSINWLIRRRVILIILIHFWMFVVVGWLDKKVSKQTFSPLLTKQHVILHITMDFKQRKHVKIPRCLCYLSTARSLLSWKTCFPQLNGPWRCHDWRTPKTNMHTAKTAMFQSRRYLLQTVNSIHFGYYMSNF